MSQVTRIVIIMVVKSVMKIKEQSHAIKGK